MKRHCSLLFFTTLLLVSCSGQNTSSTNNKPVSKVAMGDTVDKISKNTWIVFQDGQNNYWFGSDGQGVYRYDGKSILHFTTQQGLCHNQVRGIQEDSSGNVFVVTLNGISQFNGTTFTTLPVVKEIGLNIWKTGPGDLWFRGEPGKNGPYRYDGKVLYDLPFPSHYKQDELYAINAAPQGSYSPYEIYCIYQDSKGNLWFGTSNMGICRFDGKNLSWLYDEHLTLIQKTGGSFGIRSILEDRNGKFWFCNNRYRYTIYPDDSVANGGHFIRYKKEKGFDAPENYAHGFLYFQSITEDHNGDLWMSTYANGVYKYNGRELIHYPVKDGEENTTVFAMYKDRFGTIWLGSPDSGPYRFNGSSFEPFRP